MTGHLPPRTSAPRLWLGFRVIGLNHNLDNVFVYVAVIVAKASHCQSSPGSFDECRLSAGWPQTNRFGCASAGTKAATVRIRYRNLLLLLTAQTDTLLPSHVGCEAELTNALQ